MPDTVHGIPLEPGEHVLAIDLVRGADDSIIPSVIAGIVLSIILVGLVLLYRIATAKDKMRRWTIITNRRVMTVSKSGRILVEMPLSAVDTVSRLGNRTTRSASLQSTSLGKFAHITSALVLEDRAGKPVTLEDLVARRNQPAALEAIAPIAHKP